MTTIIQNIRDYLHRNGPASAQSVAEAIPELAVRGGEQRALLLMRLDLQLEPARGNLWAARGLAVNNEQKIQDATKKYFQSLGRPGAPLSSVVNYIRQETQIDLLEVRETLQKHYVVHGPNLFNRPQKGEKK